MDRIEAVNFALDNDDGAPQPTTRQGRPDPWSASLVATDTHLPVLALRYGIRAANYR